MKLTDSNNKTICRGDLVAVKFIGGRWAFNGNWIVNNGPSYYFATVSDFRKITEDDVIKHLVKVEWRDSSLADSLMWALEDPENLLLVCNSRKLKRITEPVA